MKIKTLSFVVHNSFGNKDAQKELLEKNRIEGKKTDYVAISSNADIDKKLNKELEKIENVKDIKIDYIATHQHNNGYDDTIEARYTIIYE